MTLQIERERSAVVMDDVPWDYYTHTLEVLGPSRNKRITYDEGRMEIMTTSNLHERIKSIIGDLLVVYRLEADVAATPDGSLTLRAEHLEKGLEPDACYYVQTPPPPPTRDPLDLELYPPPDLAVEVEISKGSIPKQPIYAALGVREVWRYDGKQLIVLELVEGRYVERPGSIAFPELSIPDLARFVRQAIDESEHAAMKAFRDWLRIGRGS